MLKKLFLFIIPLSIIFISLFGCKNEQDLHPDKGNDFITRFYEVNLSVMNSSGKEIVPEIYMVNRKKNDFWAESEYTYSGSEKLTKNYTVSKCEELVPGTVDYDASDMEYSFIVKIGDVFYAGFAKNEKCNLVDGTELDLSKVAVDNLGVLSAYDSCTSLMTTILEEELSVETETSYAVGSYIMHFIVNIDAEGNVSFLLNKFINTVEDDGVKTKIKVISK